MRIFIVLLALISGVFADAKEPPAPMKNQAKDLAKGELSIKKVFKEGEHYVRLSTPVRTTDPTKIEVAEVFWYGCGHCYVFEPELQKWHKQLPEDVIFVESPAMWRGNMETHARIFYTSKVLGVLDVMHRVVFEAMHIKKLKLERTEQIQTLYEQNGISGDAFKKVFDSFSVTSLVKQANARARSYGIQGTPEMIVDGTYRISAKLAGSQTGMLAVAEYLVCKINAEKKVEVKTKKKAKAKKKAKDSSAVDASSDKQPPMSSFCAPYYE